MVTVGLKFDSLPSTLGLLAEDYSDEDKKRGLLYSILIALPVRSHIYRVMK
jgi:hypothetical protein